MTPQETDQTCQCPGIPGGGVGRWWPAAGLGALSIAVHTWEEIAVIFITSTVGSVQFSRSLVSDS